MQHYERLKKFLMSKAVWPATMCAAVMLLVLTSVTFVEGRVPFVETGHSQQALSTVLSGNVLGTSLQSRSAAICCGGICGTCGTPVYVTSLSVTPQWMPHAQSSTISWTSSGADYCYVGNPAYGQQQQPPNGSVSTGPLPGPGDYTVTVYCVNVGGANSGQSGVSSIGVHVCAPDYHVQGSACVPPDVPNNDITVECSYVNDLGCPGGSQNNVGQVGRPNTGTKTLSVNMSVGPQAGDTIAASAIVQIVGDGTMAHVNPDNYPYAPGSYSNAQVARSTGAGNSYTFTITPTTPLGVYYFYAVSATKYHAWDKYPPHSGWQNIASINVTQGGPACGPESQTSISTSPGASFTLPWGPLQNTSSAYLRQDIPTGGYTALHTLTASEIASGGSYTTTAPATAGTYQYYIYMVGPSSVDNCIRTVTVSNGVSISASPTSVTEGNASTVTFSRVGSTAATQVVNWSNTGGTATYTTDWALVNKTCTNYSLGSITIPAGSASCTIQINTVPDAVSDSGETAKVSITSAPNATVGTPSSATVTITDAAGATDVCPALAGTQATYPSGSSPAGSCTCPSGTTYDLTSNSCQATATDLCPSLPGNQASYPSGSSPVNSCFCPSSMQYDLATNSCISSVPTPILSIKGNGQSGEVNVPVGTPVNIVGTFAAGQGDTLLFTALNDYANNALPGVSNTNATTPKTYTFTPTAPGQYVFYPAVRTAAYSNWNNWGQALYVTVDCPAGQVLQGEGGFIPGGNGAATCVPANGDVCSNISGTQTAAPTNGYTQNGSCGCNEGYTLQGSSCVALAQQCGAHQVQGNDGECSCDVGYSMQGGECVQQLCPGAHEVNWPTCSCDTGYTKDAGTQMCIRQPVLNIKVNSLDNTRVRKGTAVTLTWSASGIQGGSCSIKTNAGATLAHSDSGTLHPTVGAQTTYTLTCSNDAGGSVSKSVGVTLIPDFIES